MVITEIICNRRGSYTVNVINPRILVWISTVFAMWRISICEMPNRKLDFQFNEAAQAHVADGYHKGLAISCWKNRLLALRPFNNTK